MTGRVGALMDRPIADRHRGRLFTLAATMIVIAAGALSSARDTPGPPVGDRATPRPAQQAPPRVPSNATRPAPPLAARASARRFLRGYLAFLYGRARPERIAEATPELADRLRRDR